MKFYEVQQALEAGKKIRRPSMKGTYLFIFETNRHILCMGPGHNEYILGHDDLFAGDWEIEEDIPEIKLSRSKEILYICPKCERISEYTVYSEDKTEDVHECHHCGQRFRFWNLEEMKNIK